MLRAYSSIRYYQWLFTLNIEDEIGCKLSKTAYLLQMIFL